MIVGNLQDIMEKIRELTASGNSNQQTDTMVLKAIDSYYKYDFPDDLRLLKLKDVYTFNTIQGVDVYPFDYGGWSTVASPAYCAKQQVTLYQDVKLFNNLTANIQTIETFDTGDGTTGAYSGNTLGYPMLRSSNNNPITETIQTITSIFPTNYPPNFTMPTNISRVQNILISANTADSSMHVTDDGDGNLIGDCAAGGTIDYFTGAIAGLTFTTAVPSGNDINIQYVKTTLSKPYAILFTQNQFTLRPVPDQAYTIEITAYREPSEALLGITSLTSPNLNGQPELFDWWELLAFGAAKKIYQNRLDMDGVQMMDAFLQEQISGAETRTYAQLGSKTISTMFRDETNQLNDRR